MQSSGKEAGPVLRLQSNGFVCSGWPPGFPPLVAVPFRFRLPCLAGPAVPPRLLAARFLLFCFGFGWPLFGLLVLPFSVSDILKTTPPTPLMVPQAVQTSTPSTTSNRRAY